MPRAKSTPCITSSPMSEKHSKLNFHLLTVLGLSNESAEIVMDRIGELERELSVAKATELAEQARRLYLAHTLLLRGDAARALALLKTLQYASLRNRDQLSMRTSGEA